MGKIGDALISALEEMMEEGRLNPEQAMVILGEFDKSMAQHLDEECGIKGHFKGDLHTCRHFDDVYYVLAKNVTCTFEAGAGPAKKRRSCMSTNSSSSARAGKASLTAPPKLAHRPHPFFPLGP